MGAWRKFLVFVLFQVVWFACAFGAARGLWQPGVLATVVLAVWYVATSRAKVPASGLLAVSGLTGFIGESVLVQSGLLSYAAAWPGPSFAPAWIVALWVAFGATLQSLAAVLGARPILLSIPLGLFLAPLSYLAGARIGAIMLAEPQLWALAATGVLWAIALPLLMAVHHRLGDRDG